MRTADTLQAIRDAVSAHDPAGAVRWYVGNHIIDCDAEELWRVAGQALAAYDAGRR